MTEITRETRTKISLQGLTKAASVHELALRLRAVAVDVERLGDEIPGAITVETSYSPFGVVITKPAG